MTDKASPLARLRLKKKLVEYRQAALDVIRGIADRLQAVIQK